MRTLALLLAALPLVACNAASTDNSSDRAENQSAHRGGDQPAAATSGQGNARTYQIADFTQVALRGSDDVDVKVGGAFSIRAEGDPEVLDYLTVEKDGDTLKIGRRNRPGFNWGDRDAKVYVTMPRIVGGSVEGSGDMDIDRAEGASFAASTAGSGGIEIAALNVDSMSLNIAGSGDIEAAGTAKSVKANIAGSGDVDGERLKATTANVAIAGSGNVKLDVTGDAKVSILGSGSAALGANAKCQVSKMGSGSVSCGR